MLEAVYKKQLLSWVPETCTVSGFCHFITQVFIVTGEPTLYLIIGLTRLKLKFLVA